jgi:hypothetical protein
MPGGARGAAVAELLDHREWRVLVRDVSYDEDRLHGRQIGHGLSVVRSVAINLIRERATPMSSMDGETMSADPIGASPS